MDAFPSPNSERYIPSRATVSTWDSRYPQPGLQPIAHPENHDGMDLSQLPPMREAVLTADDVLQLFTDIEAHGTEVLLMQRASRTANATASRVETSESLAIAKKALLSGDIRRLQLRYRWENGSWIDTLESRPDGFRLVRITHPM